LGIGAVAVVVMAQLKKHEAKSFPLLFFVLNNSCEKEKVAKDSFPHHHERRHEEETLFF